MVQSSRPLVSYAPPVSPLVIRPGEIDPSAPASIQRQIADLIRQRIMAGALTTGDRLPSERDLADQVGRSRGTITEAYRLLAREGYAVIRTRMPVAVRRPTPTRLMDSQRYREVLEAVRNGTLDPERSGFCLDYGVSWAEYTVDPDFRTQAATKRDADLLGVSRGTRVLIRHLVEFARGVPVQMRRSVMETAVASGTAVAREENQPWPGGTIAELVSLGHEPVAVPEEIRSRPATEEEAAALYLPDEMHVLEITRRFLVAGEGGEGRTMEGSQLIMPAAGNTLRLITYL